METFLEKNRELLLNLEASQVYYNTGINNVDVDSSLKLTVDEKTVKNNKLGSLGSFVGIWRGSEIPKGIKEIIGQSPLGSGTSGGEWASKSVALTATDVDLNIDEVSVGVFLKGNDVTSLGAKVIVTSGRQHTPEGTSVTITNSTNRKIKVQYVVPEGVKPESRMDYVMLFKGDTPVANNSNPLVQQAINSNEALGTVTLDVSGILLEPGKYIIQYNAGRYSWNTINASQVFTVR